jgi:hypothetical protein
VVTSCAAPFVTVSGGWTQINLPAADVVLACALTQQAGTDGVRINAHSIKVDGPAGGSITSTGKNGIQLNAGAPPSVCDAGATVDIESAAITDNNPNGGIAISACGDIVINGSNVQSVGATVNIKTTLGQICADSDSFFGNRILLTANGDLKLSRSNFQTVGPRDLIQLVSNAGSIIAGGPTVCGPNRFSGQVESNFIATAAGKIVLQGACLDIAENITIKASGTGFSCAVDTIVDLSNSEIRNDFGKTGFISVTACGGSGLIDIGNALLVDEGKNGGGVDPNRVSSLNGGTATINVSCAATAPTCNSRPISAADNPVKADPADRALHHVIGVPRCDT